MARIRLPSASRHRTASLWIPLVAGLPKRTPRALAARSPALTRSRMLVSIPWTRANKRNAMRGQLCHKLGQVRQAAAKSVELEADNDIQTTTPNVGHEPVKTLTDEPHSVDNVPILGEVQLAPSPAKIVGARRSVGSNWEIIFLFCARGSIAFRTRGDMGGQQTGSALLCS